MELIERSGYLDILHKQLKQTARGEGFIFFLIGEAGIGKHAALLDHEKAAAVATRRGAASPLIPSPPQRR